MSNQVMLSYTQHYTIKPLYIAVISGTTTLYLLAKNYRFFQGISLLLTSRDANITRTYHLSCLLIKECSTIIVLNKAIYRHEALLTANDCIALSCIMSSVLLAFVVSFLFDYSGE